MRQKQHERTLWLSLLCTQESASKVPNVLVIMSSAIIHKKYYKNNTDIVPFVIAIKYQLMNVNDHILLTYNISPNNSQTSSGSREEKRFHGSNLAFSVA